MCGTSRSLRRKRPSKTDVFQPQRPRGVFCYGTLQHPPIFEQVTGESFTAQDATLKGYRRARVNGEPYPAITPDAAAETPGLFVPLRHPGSLDALDHYEGDLYARKVVTVDTDSGPVAAWAYILKPVHRHRLGREAWSLDSFVRRWAPLYRNL